jgi:hypothetical protein
MSRCKDIVLKTRGKLLTNETNVIVDTTITTKLVRAAEHILSVKVFDRQHPFCHYQLGI